MVEGVAVIKDKVWYSTIHDGALNQVEVEQAVGFDIQRTQEASEAEITEKVRDALAKASADNPGLRIGQASSSEEFIDGDSVYPLPEGRGAYGVSANDSGIWVVASPDQTQIASATAPPSDVMRFDPASPGAPKTFPGPAGSRFGDIALGKHHVYVSDGGIGAVLRLDPASGAWTTVIPAGRLPSPQGLAESANGRALIVADYTSGLYRVDLISGDILHLDVPETASLVGVDGGTRFGNDLIVIQNGIQPARVLRVRMSTDWKAIESVEVLLRGGKLDEPTNGVVSGDRYVFVARSQWSDFDGDGKAKATHGPAIIGEIKLTD